VRTTAIRGTATAVLVSAAVLGLAGCVNAEKPAPPGAGDSVSYDPGPSAPVTTSTTPPSGSSSATPPSGQAATANNTASGHNQADVTFARQAVLLRQQAVTMANLAANSTNAQVRALGERISKDTESTTTLTGWLGQWGQSAPSASDNVPGTLSAGKLQQLSSAKGTSFDMQWLQYMRANLTATRQAAQTEQAQAKDAQAKQLATQWVPTLKSELSALNAIG
jgi:uncharacterized protein (DUF305 family)